MMLYSSLRQYSAHANTLILIELEIRYCFNILRVVSLISWGRGRDSKYKKIETCPKGDSKF